MQTEATRLFYETILPALPYARVLAELLPKERGSYISLKCPACEKHEAYIYRGGAQIMCNRRAKCGHTESLWDYVARVHRLSGNREVLQFFAEAAGVPLPGISPEKMAEFEERRARETTRQALARHFATALWSSLREGEADAAIQPGSKERTGSPRSARDDAKRAQAVLKYLKERGYSEEQIRQMGLGVFVASGEMDLPETLAQPGLAERWPLILPWRDGRGNITGFVLRAIDPAVNPKYRFEQGFEKTELFNIDQAANEPRLVIVEGMLDALLAGALGISGVVATGGAGLTEAQTRNLAKLFNLKTIVLAFDDDRAGEEATARSLARLRGAEQAALLAVWPGASGEKFGGHKDLDAWLVKSGPEAAMEAVKTAEPAWLWELGRILARHDLGNLLETEQALGEAVTLLESAYREAENLAAPPLFLLEQLRLRILETFAIAPTGLEARLVAVKQAVAQARAKDFYTRLSGEIADKAQQGGAELGPWLKRKLLTLPRETLLTPEPYGFERAQGEWQNEPEGLKTGWTELDRFLRIAPGTLGVVAAKSRHGKTTLMLNLLLQFLEQNPEKQFIYFTYEERKSMLALKILNRMGGVVIDNTRWMQQLPLMIEIAQNKRPCPPALKEARARLTEYMDSGRLWLVDTPYTATDLAGLLPTLSQRYPIGGVLIDYAQKIPYDQNIRSDQRYLQLKYISQALLEGAMGAKVPVITACQLNRETGEGLDGITLDHVRESADIAQDANWVLALWNQSAETEQHDQNTTVDLRLLKNRDGQSGKQFTLNFNRPTLRLFPEDAYAAAYYPKKA